jgi:hypothetical protein
MRRVAARILLTIALLASLWAAVLVVFGGIEFTWSGTRLRTHEPLRPIEVAGLALALGIPLFGTARVFTIWRRLTSRVQPGVVAAGLAIFVFIVGLTYSTTTAAGADSFGYVSQASLWLAGGLKQPQPWVAQVPWPHKGPTFMPLGYRTPPYSETVLVPTYSPGLPLLMSGAMFAAGHAAAFWIVPLAGAILVLATYGIGKRLGDPSAGLIAAWFVGTSPIVLFMLMLPMSDVPAAAAWAVALYYFLPLDDRRWTLERAAAAGLAAAVAILVRPNLVPLAAVLAAGYLLRMIRNRRRWAVDATAVLTFGSVATLGAVAAAAINQYLNGSPFESGYGDVKASFAWTNVLPNALRYSGWLVQMQTPLIAAAFIPLLLPAKRLWPGVADRSLLLVLGIFVVTLWALYLPYLQFDNWTYLRFLIASWPIVMLGLAVLATSASRGAPAGRFLAVTGLVVFLGLYEYRIGAQSGAFVSWRSDRASVLVARETRRVTPANSVIFSMFHSGSVRYYGGRMSLRYDFLDGDWLDRAIEWFQAHDVHPYLLVNDWEVPRVRQRFSTQRYVQLLDRPPMFTYDSAATIFLFDLSPSDSSDRKSATLADVTEQIRNAEPAAMPPWILKE